MFLDAQKVKRAKSWIKLGFLVTYNFMTAVVIIAAMLAHERITKHFLSPSAFRYTNREN